MKRDIRFSVITPLLSLILTLTAYAQQSCSNCKELGRVCSGTHTPLRQQLEIDRAAESQQQPAVLAEQRRQAIKQQQRQQLGQGIANGITDSFNRQREASDEWARRRAEHEKWEEEMRATAPPIEPRPVQQQPVRNVTPAPPPVSDQVVPVVPTESTPVYFPNGIGTFVRDAGKETTTILVGEIRDQLLDGKLPDLGDAARSGSKTVLAGLFNEIVDDAKKAIIDKLSSESQTDLRSMRMPLSFLTFSWPEIKDAYFGPQSTWQRDVVDPINTLTEGVWPK